MKPYKCLNGHEFETDDVESYFPKCPTCGASSQPVDYDPPTREYDNQPTTSVLDDLAVIDSILADSSATEASVPDDGGWSGFSGGDSGGAGASDSFDAGAGDSSV